MMTDELWLPRGTSLAVSRTVRFIITWHRQSFGKTEREGQNYSLKRLPNCGDQNVTFY